MVSHEYEPLCVASRHWDVRMVLSKPHICDGILHCVFDVFGACYWVVLLGNVDMTAHFDVLADGVMVVVASCLAVGALAVVASCLTVGALVVVASYLTVGASVVVVPCL